MTPHYFGTFFFSIFVPQSTRKSISLRKEDVKMIFEIKNMENVTFKLQLGLTYGTSTVHMMQILIRYGPQ